MGIRKAFEGLSQQSKFDVDQLNKTAMEHVKSTFKQLDMNW
jgi:hypothetical protein